LKITQPYNSIILWITWLTATFSQLYVVHHVHKMQSIGEKWYFINELILLNANAASAKVHRTKNPLKIYKILLIIQILRGNIYI